MLGWILGLLGVGGVSVLAVGFFLRLGFFSFIPGAIANAITYVFELILRLFTWLGETFFTGESNIFSTWQGAAAQIMVVVACMMIGSAPLAKIAHWSPIHWPFHHAAVAAPSNSTDDDPEADSLMSPVFRALKPAASALAHKAKPKVTPRVILPAGSTFDSRHPLGIS